MPDDLPVRNCDIASTTGGIKSNVKCSLTGGSVVLSDPFSDKAYPGNE